jgi:excisionase family DNA binding protein
LPDYRFFGETAAPCHCEEVQPARRKIPAFNKEQNLVSASPAIDPAAPVKGPDIIDHLKSSERLMTARELASILSISPKTIYSYAERNMIPHFKIEASVRFRGRDVAEWLYKHASLRRVKR